MEINFMKKSIVVKFAFLIIISILAGCASSGENLKKQNSQLYNQIVNSTIYILSNENYGKTPAELTLREDGNISGDLNVIKHNAFAAMWTYKKGKIIIEYSDASGRYKGNIKIEPEYRYASIPAYKENDNVSFIYIYSNINSSRCNVFPCAVGDSKLKAINDEFDIIKKDSSSLWAKTNKKNYKSIIAFYREQNKIFKKYNSPIPDIESISSTLYSILDLKVLAYIKKYHNKFYRYAKSTIYYVNGQKSYMFYEILRNPILSKNPDSGYKMEYELVKSSKGFDLVIESNGQKNYFTFKPYKKNLTIISYKVGWQVNPKNWEMGFAMLADSFAAYPDFENLDYELIDSL